MIILVSAIVLSLLVKTFLVQAFFIPSQSMHDTLIEDDRILVSKLTPGPFDLRRGDIVVFKDPGGWLPADAAPDPGPVRGCGQLRPDVHRAATRPDANEHLVKRLIGLPGDHVVCCDAGGPVVGQRRAARRAVPRGRACRPATSRSTSPCPTNSIWVMGDNRPHSSDSRYNQGNPGGGSVPIDNVVGMAFVTVWPHRAHRAAAQPDQHVRGRARPAVTLLAAPRATAPRVAPHLRHERVLLRDGARLLAGHGRGRVAARSPAR